MRPDYSLPVSGFHRPCCRRFLLFILLLSCLYSRAQIPPISGTVTDEEDKPLAGASITLKDKKGGTHAGPDGSWRLQASPGD
ncbi:MAG: hypothetical protein ABUL46_04080, partial [Chitinophaga rupis]